MNERKFTPEEIAKSLRVCIDNAENGCSGCVTHHLGGNKACDALSEAAADMIEELAAEVARFLAELIQRNDELLKLREEREALEKQCHEAIQLLGRANNLLAQRTQELQSMSALTKAQDDCIVKCREEILRLREENRWIPTSERKPDRELEAEPKGADGKPLLGGYECIAMIEGAKRPTALWYCHIDGEGVWLDDAAESCYPVTHWKPMPKGPEVGHE